MSAFTREQAIEVVDTISNFINQGFKLNGNPGAIPKAAEVLNITPSSVRRRLAAAQEKFGIKMVVDKHFKTTPVVEEKDEPLSYRERRQLLDKIKDLNKELKAAHNLITEGEALRDKLFGLPDTVLEPPKWTIKLNQKQHECVPVLLISDIHYGEVVRKSVISNNNEYNVAKAKERYKRVIERTIKICDRQRAHLDWPGIVIGRLGDNISGNIHNELVITNEINEMQQVTGVAEMEIWGLETLADYFGSVWVISVPGNHARNTPNGKVMNKLYTDASFDNLITYMLEQHFQDDTRFKWYTPPSGEAVFKIFDWTIAALHGDNIGVGGAAGQGYVGVGAPIIRGVKKFRDSYAALGQTFDHVWMGHFHSAFHTDSNVVVNPSLIGYNDYAQKVLRCLPSPPAQTLMFYEPDVGIGARHLVLAETGRMSSKPYISIG